MEIADVVRALGDCLEGEDAVIWSFNYHFTFIFNLLGFLKTKENDFQLLFGGRIHIRGCSRF